MTCIVAVTDGETVTMGGDSAGVDDNLDLLVRADSKVWANRGWVFGFTSSFRMGQLIRYRFTPPPRDEAMDLEEYMASVFVDEVRQVLRDGGYTRVENNVESGGCFLVGHAGRLFFVEEDFQVGESVKPWMAVGCGEPFALGALAVMDPDMPAPQRVREALKVAESYSGGVRGPFKVVAA